MQKRWLVAKDTYKRNIASLGFILSALAPLLLILIGLGIGILNAYLTSDAFQSETPSEPDGERTFAVVSADAGLADAFTNDDAVTFRFDLSEQERIEQLRAHELDGYFEIDARKHPAKIVYYYLEGGADDALLSRVTRNVERYQTAQAAKALGLADADARALVEQETTVSQVDLAGDETLFPSDPNGGRFAFRTLASWAIGVILVLFVTQFTNMIAQEIVREKGSRMIEIVLSSMDVSDHFFGKLLGLALLIGTVVGFYGILIAGALVFAVVRFPALAQVVPMVLGGIWQRSGDLLLWSFVFGLLGIVVYVLFAAFTGSLITQQEDAGCATRPALLLLLVGFYLNIYLVLLPANEPLTVVLSHIPFFAPLLIPTRLAQDAIGVGELILALGIHIAFIALSLWLSVTFYRSNVLTYSDKGLIAAFKQSLALYRSEQNTPE